MSSEVQYAIEYQSDDGLAYGLLVYDDFEGALAAREFISDAQGIWDDIAPETIQEVVFPDSYVMDFSINHEDIWYNEELQEYVYESGIPYIIVNEGITVYKLGENCYPHRL